MLSDSNGFIVFGKMCEKTDLNVKISHGFKANSSYFDERNAKNLSNELEYHLRNTFHTNFIKIEILAGLRPTSG